MNNINWWLLVIILWVAPMVAQVWLAVWTNQTSLLKTFRGLAAAFAPGYNLFILAVFCLIFAYGYALNKDKWKKQQ